MRRIPYSLIEAAKIEGAGEWYIFTRFCLPQCRAALYSIVILVFIDYWNMVEQQTASWNAENAQQIVQSVISSGKEFNVIYAENDDMAKGAVAALDAANISHGVGKDVIVMGFDCNKWALEELLAGNWNYDGQCNPFQASYIDDVIKNGAPAEKTIIMDEKGFDATTITQEDVDTYGI